MEIQVDQLGEKLLCARLRGRMDSAGVDKADLRFSAAVVAPGRDAIIDLSGVDFLASMGIRLLITSARSLKSKGARFVLFGAQEAVGSVLEHVAIDQIIPVFASEDQAIAHLAH